VGPKVCLDVSVKRNWGEDKCIQALVKKRDHFEDLGVHGRIILKWTSKKGMGPAMY
jgi:hypothetical protein